jgi:hypothetical protein
MMALLLPAQRACAEGAPDSTDQGSVFTCAFNDGRRALGAGWRAITSPLRWDGTDAIRAGVLGIGAGSAALLDDEAAAVADRSRNGGNDRLQRIVVRYGDGVPLALLSAGLYGLGALTGDRWLRETGLLVGTAVLFSSAVVQFVKPIAGRARPFADRGNALFRPFTFSDTYHSFPSGHSAAAFAASTVLAERVDNPWASAGFYALATAGALSRIYSRDHWLSDVAASAAFAVPLSMTLVREFEGAPGQGQTQRLTICPMPDGVAVVWVF